MVLFGLESITCGVNDYVFVRQLVFLSITQIVAVWSPAKRSLYPGTLRRGPQHHIW